jgi:hypothetical protein
MGQGRYSPRSASQGQSEKDDGQRRNAHGL